MAEDKTNERWREAALSGRIDRLTGMVEEMTAANWPEYKGQIFVREYGVGEGADTERDRYGEFVSNLYSQKFHTPTKGETPADSLVMRESYRDEALKFYDEGPGAQAPRSAATDDQYQGLQFGQSLTYIAPDGKGGDSLKEFKVSTLNVNAHSCRYCATTAALKATPENCELTSPDEVFKARLNYFNTTVHELAHGVRDLKGSLKYDTEPDKRREENIAVVFASLMQVKVFGAVGMLQLRNDVANVSYKGDDVNMLYEAVGPLTATLEAAMRYSDVIARTKPAELLQAAEILVDTYDPTRKMSPQERADYSDFITFANTSKESASERLAEGPAHVFNILKSRIAHDSQGNLLPDPNPQTVILDYTPAMQTVDEAIVKGALLKSELEDMQMRLNPLRPMSMRKDSYFMPDPANFDKPDWQKDLADFSKEFNHPSCDMPKLFADQLKELREAQAITQAASKRFDEMVKKPTDDKPETP